MKLSHFMAGFIVLLAILSVASAAYANCQGCCSNHGGVTCQNGVTMCADGTPLSSTCKAKGCNECGSPNPPLTPIKHILTPIKDKRSYSAKPVSSSHLIKICECGGILLLTNMGGCPCNLKR